MESGRSKKDLTPAKGFPDAGPMFFVRSFDRAPKIVDTRFPTSKTLKHSTAWHTCALAVFS
jgi:hypothetical protein